MSQKNRPDQRLGDSEMQFKVDGFFRILNCTQVDAVLTELMSELEDFAHSSYELLRGPLDQKTQKMTVDLIRGAGVCGHG